MKAFRLVALAPFLVACGDQAVPVASAPPAPPDSMNRTASAPPTETPLSKARVYDLASLKTVKLSLRGKPYRMWIMDNPGKRQEGMMFLTPKEVARDQGMIFVFPTVQKAADGGGFWMRNTSLPLDIIYIGPDGRVVSVGNGVPFKESSVLPKGDYRWVIELLAGNAKEIGLKAGDRVSLPASLVAAD